MVAVFHARVVFKARNLKVKCLLCGCCYIVYCYIVNHHFSPHSHLGFWNAIDHYIIDHYIYCRYVFLSVSQQHVTFDPTGSYAVENLKPDTLYKFSLAARSEMGLGVYTQPIEARTAQSSKY